MSENDSDIKNFNTYVNNQKTAYYANKHQNYDDQVLLSSLFEAYKSCQDKGFVAYITRKEDDHNDGTTTMTSKVLMDSALKNFQTKSELDEWKQETAEQKEMVNLVAQLKTSSDKIKLLEDKANAPKKPNPKKKKDDKNEEKKSPEEYRKERFANAPAWMKQAPTDGKGSIKHDGDTYHWCPNHKLFQKHLPRDCRLKTQNGAAKAKTDDALQLDDKLTQFALDDEDLEYNML